MYENCVIDLKVDAVNQTRKNTEVLRASGIQMRYSRLTIAIPEEFSRYWIVTAVTSPVIYSSAHRWGTSILRRTLNFPTSERVTHRASVGTREVLEVMSMSRSIFIPAMIRM